MPFEATRIEGTIDTDTMTRIRDKVMHFLLIEVKTGNDL